MKTCHSKKVCMKMRQAVKKHITVLRDTEPWKPTINRQFQYRKSTTWHSTRLAQYPLQTNAILHWDKGYFQYGYIPYSLVQYGNCMVPHQLTCPIEAWPIFLTAKTLFTANCSSYVHFIRTPKCRCFLLTQFNSTFSVIILWIANMSVCEWVFFIWGWQLLLY